MKKQIFVREYIPNSDIYDVFPQARPRHVPRGKRWNTISNVSDASSVPDQTQDTSGQTTVDSSQQALSPSKISIVKQSLNTQVPDSINVPSNGGVSQATVYDDSQSVNPDQSSTPISLPSTQSNSLSDSLDAMSSYDPTQTDASQVATAVDQAVQAATPVSNVAPVAKTYLSNVNPLAVFAAGALLFVMSRK